MRARDGHDVVEDVCEGRHDAAGRSVAFVRHVKVMFIRDAGLEPEPPVTRVGKGTSTRGAELASLDDLDERLAASWMKQAAGT